MPEPQGWTLVTKAAGEPTGWTLVEPAKPTHEPTLSEKIDAGLTDNPSLGMVGRTAMWLGRQVKKDPVTTGAIAGGVAAAPFTGGASAMPAMAMVGLGTAAGAGVGIAGRQLATGRPEPASQTLQTMASQGALGALGEGVLGHAVPAAARFAVKAPVSAAAKVADLAGMVGVPGARPVASGLRLLQRLTGGAAEAAPAAANAGGRLVKAEAGEPIELAISDALEQTRTAAPKAVTLPPQPTLPPGYTPRATAPKPTTAPTRIARPVAPPSPRAAPPAQELPASWKQLVEQPKAVPVPRDTAPLGLSDDAPMWSRGGSMANDARDMRGAMGAEDAGALMDMPADEVRALSGAPKRRPLVADLAEMDRGYMRQLANPLAGVALGVPTADVLRRALIEALSAKHGAPSPQ